MRPRRYSHQRPRPHRRPHVRFQLPLRLWHVGARRDGVSARSDSRCNRDLHARAPYEPARQGRQPAPAPLQNLGSTNCQRAPALRDRNQCTHGQTCYTHTWSRDPRHMNTHSFRGTFGWKGALRGSKPIVEERNKARGEMRSAGADSADRDSSLDHVDPAPGSVLPQA